MDTKSLGDVRGCKSLGVVGLDVEAFFISSGASSSMRVEETARMMPSLLAMMDLVYTEVTSRF